MRKSIRVLHVFHEYLQQTENWSFRLIDNLPDTDIVIASKHFRKCNFYPSKFEYLEFPVRWFDQSIEKPSIRFFNKIANALLLLYPQYVKGMCGKVDLMHSHFSFIGWEYRTLAKELKIPHVVSFYGFDYEWLPYNKPIWNERYKVLFKDASLFLCEGKFGANLLEKIGCPSEKIKIVRLGVDVKKTPWFQREKKPDNLKLLQVATLTGKKGHIYTVKAFLKSIDTCPNMSLTIVGKHNAEYRERIENIIGSKENGKKIRFLEWVDHDHLHEFFGNYDLFIHPSCYTEEKDCEGGAPVVLLDAQATGMPVISTIHCDIPDVVIHGKTGLLSMEKDIDRLSEYICNFYHMDNEEYQVYSCNARRHVEENYDVEKNAGKLKEIYDEIIKKPEDHPLILGQ